MTPLQGTELFVAAMLAGAVNSVAGGGTLITFPALFNVLGPSGALVANATSTVALWPGQLSSLFGYRKEIGNSRDAIQKMAIPSVVGGGIGAALLLHTSPGQFVHIVPFLILLATVLFMAQEPISRMLKGKAQATDSPAENRESGDSSEMDAGRSSGVARTAEVMVFQLLVAIYGGYFGAGIGILMLAALGFMGFNHIHRMNGIKNLNGLLINMVAICFFIFGHTAPGAGVGANHNSLIDWPLAFLMMCGSIVGGYSGAGIARKIGQKNVRKIIICLGFALAISLFRK